MKFQLVILTLYSTISFSKTFKEVPGCPENAVCSSKLGQEFIKWNELVKTKPSLKRLNAHAKKFGVPTAHLLTKDVKSEEHAVWNSRCKHHNKKNAVTFKAVSFLKNYKNVHMGIAYLKREDKTLKFSIPYQEVPRYIQGNNLILTREFEGIYLDQSINQNGSFKFINRNASAHNIASLYNEKVQDCNQEISSKLFTAKTCMNIWNHQRKKTERIEFYWPCY